MIILILWSSSTIDHDSKNNNNNNNLNLNLQKCSEAVVFAHFDFEMCFAPQRPHFLDISSSKSALNVDGL